METEIVAVDKENVRDEDLLEAAHIIRKGGLVAFPTETVYGLGANALDEEAAKKIYEAKGRPSDNPLIAHIAQCSELEPLVSEIPEAGRRLTGWPGARGASNWETGTPSTATSRRDSRDFTLLRLLPFTLESRKGSRVVGWATV